MVEAAADDGVEDRVLAVRHRQDFHHLAVRARAVVLRKLAERSLGLAHAGQDAAFDHDLGFGRNADLARLAFHHGQRPALQRAGDLEFVMIERHDRLRRQQRQRVDADDDRDVERLPGLLGHLEERVGMTRQNQNAEPIGAGHLAAMDGDVLLAGLRIARDHEARADVGAAIVLVMRRHRQLLEQIDLPVHHLLHRCVADLLPGQRTGRGLLEPGEQFVRLDRHRLGHPAAV